MLLLNGVPRVRQQRPDNRLQRSNPTKTSVGPDAVGGRLRDPVVAHYVQSRKFTPEEGAFKFRLPHANDLWIQPFPGHERVNDPGVLTDRDRDQVYIGAEASFEVPERQSRAFTGEEITCAERPNHLYFVLAFRQHGRGSLPDRELRRPPWRRWDTRHHDRKREDGYAYGRIVATDHRFGVID